MCNYTPYILHTYNVLGTGPGSRHKTRPLPFRTPQCGEQRERDTHSPNEKRSKGASPWLGPDYWGSGVKPNTSWRRWPLVQLL